MPNCNHDCENCVDKDVCEKECSGDCQNCESSCNGDCSSCGASCSHNMSREDFLKPCNKYSSVKHVIAVMSGKGGVGKSMVTSLLAVELRRQGFKVGILDADITGPSIPKAFGLTGKVGATQDSILPKETKIGIKVMSSNLLLDNVTDPIIWRGPVIAGLVEQFWTDVLWEELDYLLVDMPPGTGDVPLTVFQSLPVNGIVVVTSPQDLVSMIVEKAVHMAEKMDINVLGLVENMSYFVCPSCMEKHSIFGNSNIDEIAASFNIDTVSKMPIDGKLASLTDEGLIENIEEEYLKNITYKLIDLDK